MTTGGPDDIPGSGQFPPGFADTARDPNNPTAGQRAAASGTSAVQPHPERWKLYGVIIVFAFLLVMYVFSTFRKEKTNAPPPPAPSFNFTGTDKSPSAPVLSLPSQGTPTQPSSSPVDDAAAAVAQLEAEAHLLQARAAIRQAQYQLQDLRLTPHSAAAEARLMRVDAGPASLPSPTKQPPSSPADPQPPLSDAAPIFNPSANVLRVGTFLDGVLINKLVTDNYTSPVLAMIDRPYYDPLTRKLLVPAGTRLIGKAEAVQYQSSSRLALTFDTLQFPNGRTQALTPTAPGLEGLGSFGLADDVNRHTLRILFTAGLVGVLTGWNNSQIQTGTGGTLSGTDMMRLQASQSITNTTQQMLSPFLNAMPTITVNEGHRLKIWIVRDLPLNPYEAASNE